jgi:SAM-dependent methyltransferase
MLTVRFDRLGLAPGARVLDLGCGEGRHVHGLAMLPGVVAVGLDPDAASLVKARDGLATLAGAGPAAFLRGSAYALPFADGAFDAVICSEVLEHLDDYPAALAEIARVLRPGGRFVATVPRAWPERLCWALAPGEGGYADQPGGHVRVFDAAALRRAIEARGFGYRGRHFAHALHSPYWWLKTAFWRWRDDHPAVHLYHRLLVWDLMKRPRVTRLAERALDPVMGKSVALYFERSENGSMP